MPKTSNGRCCIFLGLASELLGKRLPQPEGRSPGAMKLTAEEKRRKRLHRYFPVILCAILFFLQMAAEPPPGYNRSRVGYDATFAALAFDIWAIQTVFSQRLVAYGGIFDLPTKAKLRSHCQIHDGMVALVTLIVHFIILTVYISSAGEVSGVYHLVAVGAALIGSVGQVDGWFMDKECDCAAS